MVPYFFNTSVTGDALGDFEGMMTPSRNIFAITFCTSSYKCRGIRLGGSQIGRADPVSTLWVTTLVRPSLVPSHANMLLTAFRRWYKAVRSCSVASDDCSITVRSSVVGRAIAAAMTAHWSVVGAVGSITSFRGLAYTVRLAQWTTTPWCMRKSVPSSSLQLKLGQQMRLATSSSSTKPISNR